MESSPGSHGAGLSRRLKDPFCSRRSLNLQGALLFVIFSTHSQWVAANRDTRITVFNTTGPWDKTRKTEGHCLDFHSKYASKSFYYWPEDDPDFEYCCPSPDRVEMLQNYTYGEFGPRLSVGKYYDLGLIDRCLPYWNCKHLFQTYFKTNMYFTYCEVNDLRKLYKRRFLVGTVLQHGLLESAIPFIISLEALVVILAALYWCIWRRLVDGSKVMKAWFRYSRKTIVKDWTHLCLLAIVGNGLIEAIGRQNAYSPQSKTFYNYARLYVVLSILVWYSSLLLQVTYWIAEIDLEYKESPSAAAAGKSQVAAAHSKQEVQNTNSVEQQSPSIQQSAILKLEKEFGLTDDWKWQPIAAQTGILFCLWGFLTYNVVKDDATTGSVFGLIVSAACPWSGLYASTIIARAFPWILGRLYRNLRKPQQNRPPYQWLWRSRLRLNRWVRKARAEVAGQDDSGTLLEPVPMTEP